jgi:two-component system sensor histidine kinase GlrK
MGKLALLKGNGQWRDAGDVVPQREPKQLPPVVWHTAAGAFVAIALMTGVSLYALSHLRQTTTLSLELVSYRYPAIETAKWLLTSLYAQLTSEKKYLAVQHPNFLMEFEDEAEDFRQTLATLQNQEHSPEGRKLLDETARLYVEYHRLFRTHVDRGARPVRPTADYEARRDAVVERMTHRLQSYVGVHETWISSRIGEVREGAARAQHLTRQLTVVALLLTLAAVGAVGFGMLRMRRRQAPADQPSSRDAGSIPGGAPPNQREAASAARRGAMGTQ